MPKQAVKHAGQTAEQRRAAPDKLRVVGNQAEQQRQADQVDTALARLDTPPQLPVPHAVHRQVQDAEVDQHRRDQAPPLPRRQAVGQWREVDVLADHAEFEEGQPAHRFKVVTQQGDRADDHAQQQYQRGGPGVFQLLDEPRTVDGLRQRNVQLLIGIARRKTFVQCTHVFTDVLWHP
ncbi:hypothetical protein D3C87_908150 [compost metagenome]